MYIFLCQYLSQNLSFKREIIPFLVVTEGTPMIPLEFLNIVD